jgi:NADH:ubiquinone oxidoreductase subunit 6 (subunit J)
MPTQVVKIALMLLVLASACPALAQAPAESGEAVTQTAQPGGALEALMFYLFAAVVLGSGLAICISTNVVRMAVYLFVTLAGIAVLYFLLLANFIAVIQLIVYAGGTLILLIFGVMLTSKSPWARFDVKRSEMIAAGAVCIVFAAALLALVVNANWPVTEATVAGPQVADFGHQLMTTYLVPFEAVSVLLLVVMIGAALMARQE